MIHTPEVIEFINWAEKNIEKVCSPHDRPVGKYLSALRQERQLRNDWSMSLEQLDERGAWYMLQELETAIEDGIGNWLCSAALASLPVPHDRSLMLE